MTSQQIAHEKLVEEVAQRVSKTVFPEYVNKEDREIARAILSLISARLADVTEEMVRAHDNHDGDVQEPFQSTYRDSIVSDWRAMLSASALVSGREG